MAANLGFRELTKDVQAFVTFPNDVTVEILEDKTIATQVAFHHIHEQCPISLWRWRGISRSSVRLPVAAGIHLLP